MSFLQCIYAAMLRMVRSLRSFMVKDKSDYRYYSKSFQRRRNDLYYSMDDRSNPIVFYYRRPLQSPCTLTTIGILTRCLTSLLFISLVYLTTKALLTKYRRFKSRPRTSSALIDETEVELNTINSIYEFKKNIGSSDERLPRKMRKKGGGLPDDTDTTLNLSGSCSSNQVAPYDNERRGMNIYSMLSSPLNGIRNMLSNFSSYNTTGGSIAKHDEQINMYRKRQRVPEVRQGDNTIARASPRASITPFNSASSTKRPAKKLKDCSVNTEVKSFKINDLSSFTSVDKSGNETDMEKEMALIDIPTNYYYENRLSGHQPSPCLMSLNKGKRTRKRSQRPF